MSALNFYGQPITPPEYFDGEHVANPMSAGLPPVCSCGWTRWQIEDGPHKGEWFEISDHLADMRGSAGTPWADSPVHPFAAPDAARVASGAAEEDRCDDCGEFEDHPKHDDVPGDVPTPIRAYLEAKAAEPESEWLRRQPRTTHPDILEAVREWEAAGGTYDDDGERFVNERAGDLPPHRRHGADDRDRLIDQLGHEVYLARRILDDLEASEKLAALQADGFVPLDESAIVDGARYVICFGTLYSGHSVPTYSKPQEVRARRSGSGFVYLPRGARTRGFLILGPALVKAAA